MSGFDFDMFNSLDHDLSTEEYELVEFDQPSVDELVSFINGSGGSRPAASSAKSTGAAASAGNGAKSCHMHTSGAQAGEAQSENGASKKKSKKKKKKKKAATQQSAAQAQTTSASKSTQARETAKKFNNQSLDSSKRQPESTEEDDDEDENDDENESESESSDDTTVVSVRLPRDLQEKMRLARQNPSAIFLESQFEDEDEEMQEQIESFRLALESAHLESSKNKAQPKPRVKFAPQDVFRSTLVASQRHSSQRVSAAI